MSEFVNRTGWSKGAHNRSTTRSTPEGYVREAVNFVSTKEGTLRSRPSIGLIREAQDSITAACAYGASLAYCDGLTVYELQGSTPVRVAPDLPAAATGMVDVLGALYVATPVGGQYLWQGRLLPWAPLNPAFTVASEAGNLLEGRYRVAVVTLDAAGRTSGTASQYIDITPGQAIRVSGVGRVYISTPNGSTLYYQGESAATFLCTRVDDDRDRLTTDGLQPMPVSSQLTSHNALLVAVVGKQLWVSVPFAPYLCDMSKGFFSFPAPVTNCVSCGDGLFVTADKTYYVRGIESAAPEQITAWEEPAVAGTAVTTPDGKAAWFTARGLAIGSEDGSVRWATDEQYAPRVAQTGVSGYINVGGVPAVLTSMGGGASSTAAAHDSYDLEIRRNEK